MSLSTSLCILNICSRSNSQPNDIESLHGMLQLAVMRVSRRSRVSMVSGDTRGPGAVDVATRCTVLASVAGPVLRRENQGGKPQIRQREVEREEIAAVGFECGGDHGAEVEEKG